MFGFKKNSKYVSNYLHKANLRSGIYMGAVVILLETWLIIRQHTQHIIEETFVNHSATYLKNLFNFTSLFWLNLVVGLAMVAYCIYYLKEKNKKSELITICVISGIGLLLTSMLPLEANIKALADGTLKAYKYVDVSLLITFYSGVALFQASIVFAAIYKYKGGTKEWILGVIPVTLFGFILLVFGVKVSYSDFFSTKDIKQIICFLTMVIYVACLLIWKPYISIGILGAVFLAFYFMLTSNPSLRALPDGDKVNYITFFISLTMVSISIFNQRLHEARKDERLELLATVDLLTGLMTFNHFLDGTNKKLAEEKLKGGEYAFIFLNINSFKVFNDQKGHVEGDKILRYVGNIISNAFPKSLISRQSDDHYVAFVKNDDLEKKLDIIREQVEKLDKDLKMSISMGYYINEDGEADARIGVEKARYANAELKARGLFGYLPYDKTMHDQFNLVQYIVSHVDEAVRKGWIVAYYQPVVFSKDNTLCGVEALARWIDPKYGFLNPGMFIGALESSHLAHKVDLAMLDLVCKNMRRVLDEGGTIVPTSINFSRADFAVADIPDEVVKITNKYKIPANYLHIEITESALLDEQTNLVDSMSRLRKNGFALWLDDFGSGYSSFNTVKDYEFDVLKLDMMFLKGFEHNKKAQPVVQSVIKMAESINMRTLCEGVETKEQAAFLKRIGCERLQGYLFSKPISYEDLNAKISSGELIIAKNLD